MAAAERTGLPGVKVELGRTVAESKSTGQRQAAVDCEFAKQCCTEAINDLNSDPTVCAVCNLICLLPHQPTVIVPLDGPNAC